MSCSNASSKKGKGKVVENPGSKHVWTPEKDEKLVECLLEIAQQPKWKCDNGTFKAGHLKELELMMQEKLPGCDVRGQPHIFSRMRLWKKQYQEIAAMRKDTASGFGWNDNEKCVTCEKSVWDDWVKSHPRSAGLRNKYFPYYDQFSMIFGNDRATGDRAEGPADAVEELDDEPDCEKMDGDTNYFDLDADIDDVDLDAVESGSDIPPIRRNQEKANTAASVAATATSSGQKRPRQRRSFTGLEGANDEFNSTVTAIRTMVQGSGDHVEKLAKCFQFLADDAEAKKEVFNEIVKIEGLAEVEKVKAGGLICGDSNKVRYFFSLPDEYKKAYVEWVLDGCP